LVAHATEMRAALKALAFRARALDHVARRQCWPMGSHPDDV